MDQFTLALLAVLVLGFGVFSGRFEKTPLTPPLAFMMLGLFLGPAFMDLLNLNLNSHGIKILAEATLVLVLFTDASRINMPALKRTYNIPLRLLAVGLPLCILMGWGAAYWIFPGLGVWGAALMASILAPTDAALGQAVIANENTPLRVRQAINVESGLNDGMALPMVLIFFSLADPAKSSQSADYWLVFFARQILLAPLVGALIGWLGGVLLTWADKRGTINTAFRNLAALSLAALAYCLAESAGASGLISAFVAGLTMGTTATKACDELYEFAESEGQLLALGTFLAFGAMMAYPALTHAKAIHWFYALLSLTVLRMLPVWLSLLGTRLRLPTTLYIGWFGPRGLASILFGLLLLEDSQIVGQHEILLVMALTVFISVLVHGISAWPLSLVYARVAGSWPAGAEPSEELQAAEELPLRVPYGEKSHTGRRFWRDRLGRGD